MNPIQSAQEKVAAGIKILSQAIKLKSYRKLAINFLILTLNLIVIVLYFTLSQAKVIVIPERENITHKLQIPIKETAALGEKAVSGRLISETAAGSETFVVPGSSEVPSVATGEITIYNKTTNRTQHLVAKTQFANNAGVVIRLKERAAIGPGQTVTVAAYADQEGREGEVEPGKFEIVKLKSDKDKIYGEVAKKFTGGAKKIKTITPEFYAQARQETENKAKKLAWDKLSSQSPQSDKEQAIFTVADAKPSAKVGDIGIDNLIMEVEATAKTVIFDQEAAKRIIADDFARAAPPNKTVVEIDEDSFTALSDAEGKYLEASLTGVLQQKFSEAIFRKKDIVGLNRDEVKKHFRKITGINAVEIKFSPFWVRSVPNLEDHVDIEIKKN